MEKGTPSVHRLHFWQFGVVVFNFFLVGQGKAWGLDKTSAAYISWKNNNVLGIVYQEIVSKQQQQQQQQ